MIEYYHGILFLTTNRISAFDAAFVSRIHLAIYYPPLTQPNRSKLLYTFLKQISQTSADNLRKDGSLESIAKERLNGRQIKNLVRAACALAQGDSAMNDGISRRHLDIALQPMRTFHRVIERVRLNKGGQVSGVKEDVEEEEEQGSGGSDVTEGIQEEEEEDGDEDEEESNGGHALQQTKRRRLM